MKRIVASGWLAAGVCGAVGGCAAHDAQGKAAAPIGSWKGSVVAFDLGSDGRVSYKDPGIAEFTGRWEWLPTRLRAPSFLRLRLLAQLTHCNFL
jgi:hypothetical protein